VKDTLISGFVGTASSVPTYFAGAPWWVPLLAMFLTGLLLLASRLIDYREVHRLARLANSGSVKGREGIEWKASTEPAQPEPDEPEAPKPKHWFRRKSPPEN
jgi:hypothetical protein